MFYNHKKAFIALFSLFLSFLVNAADLKIVTTNFPQYDLVKHIVKDRAEVSMLLKPGAEAHSYEPTPADLIKISKSDLFVYNGGENDEWIEDLVFANNPQLNNFAFIKAVNLLDEELVEGMQNDEHHHKHHDHDDEHEKHNEDFDEHVWTSPKNDVILLQKLADKISLIDEENKDFYQSNAQAYIDEFEQLDKKFKKLIEDSKFKTLIFGDRFPFLYFAKEYKLDYYAAFSGCSSDTEISAGTLKFLIDKARELKSPVVLKIEQSSSSIADAIADASDKQVMTMHSGHNVSVEELENNTSLASIFNSNLEVLNKALN